MTCRKTGCYRSKASFTRTSQKKKRKKHLITDPHTVFPKEKIIKLAILVSGSNTTIHDRCSLIGETITEDEKSSAPSGFECV